MQGERETRERTWERFGVITHQYMMPRGLAHFLLMMPVGYKVGPNIQDL